MAARGSDPLAGRLSCLMDRQAGIRLPQDCADACPLPAPASSRAEPVELPQQWHEMRRYFTLRLVTNEFYRSVTRGLITSSQTGW